MRYNHYYKPQLWLSQVLVPADLFSTALSLISCARIMLPINGVGINGCLCEIQSLLQATTVVVTGLSAS